jgi:hypothetical protein
MISEKTVELNLATELINWFYYVTGQIHYALAPSQRQEGQLVCPSRLLVEASDPV